MERTPQARIDLHMQSPKGKSTLKNGVSKKREEEVGYLSGLDAFIKGLTFDDIAAGITKDQVLDTLWAYGARGGTI
jgi:hypothetical protein